MYGPERSSDARRLPHRDPRHRQQGKDEDADEVLQLCLKGRVDVCEEREGRDHVDGSLHLPLLTGGHRLSSRTISYIEAWKG
jgi:hypothetical protein